MYEDLNEIFAFERKIFLFFGLYPSKSKKPIADVIKAILVFAFSMLLPISMIIKLLIGVDSLEEFSDILYYLTTQTAYICKLCNFLFGPGNLLLIEQRLRHQRVYKYFEKFGWDGLDEIVNLSNYFARIFRILIFFILILYAAFPYIDGNRELPFGGWLPGNVHSYKWCAYVLQLSCLYISALTNGNMDLFAVYLMSIGVGMLRLIKKALRNVDYAKRNGNDKNLERLSKGEFDIHPDNLPDLYLLHEYIYEYLAAVENLFSYGIFIQFLASIAVICMTGFQMMITPPQSGQFVLLIFYIACMMCQVVMYCWYGNEILVESDGMGEACYMSNWYEGSKSDKKFLIILMERSKRQVRLTAGKFFTLSLPTLVMILKSSYSYFAVLQRLYADK